MGQTRSYVVKVYKPHPNYKCMQKLQMYATELCLTTDRVSGQSTAKSEISCIRTQSRSLCLGQTKMRVDQIIADSRSE